MRAPAPPGTMKTPGRLFVAVLLLLPLPPLFAQAERRRPLPKPNIVLIIADDLGWRDLSSNGSQYYETPHLDRLSAQGMFFTNAYANAPNCVPSRAAIFSGQYSPRTGVYTVGNSDRGQPAWRALVPTPNTPILDASKITIAEALKSAGYATGFVGKWHIGSAPDTGPRAQGFDVNVAGSDNGKPSSYFSPYGHPLLADGPPGEYLTDRLTDEAIKFIDTHRHSPFFLALAHHAPHTPIQAKDPLVWKYIPKPAHNGHYDPIYAAMIETLDTNVGRLLEKLEELGLADNTIVVFFSDNGGLHAVTSMRPLNGHKGTLYEGGIRVPLIVRWPGTVASGTVCHQPVAGTDFYPTFLEAAGADPPRGYPLDGESLVPLLRQEGAPRREAIYWHYPVYLQGGYGLNTLWRTTPVGAIRVGDYKLLEFFEDDRIELYDLRLDLGEQTNLAEAEPRRARDLAHRLTTWRRRVNAPFPLAKNPAYDPSLKPTNTRFGKREDVYSAKAGE